MARVGILSGYLEGIVTGHKVLDLFPEAELHLITESAEMGLLGEGPGIFSRWPLVPEHWVSGLGAQTPGDTSTAVRRSWLEKAMATALASRGCTIHLRTRGTERGENGSVSFVGAGLAGKGSIEFDKIVEATPVSNSSKSWEGGVCFPDEPSPTQYSGIRTDGSLEVWWCETPPISATWIQRMTWLGEDPTIALHRDIDRGILSAEALVDTIIQ